MSFQGVPATPPRLDKVWDALTDRLRTGLVVSAPTDPAQVYRVGENPYRGGEGAMWWRLALVPITRAWPVEEQPGRAKLTPFMIRAEVHLPNERMDSLPKLEQLQQEVFPLLHGWKPDDAELTSNQGTMHATVRLVIRRTVPPDPRPLKDPDTDLWFTSSEYLIVVETPDLAT